MKKKILSFILTLIMIANAILIFSVPTSAWTWATDGGYEVASYDAAIVASGAITVDAELDHAYLTATMITSYKTPYNRAGYSSDVSSKANGEFFAFVAGDDKGMYIYVEIEDSTIFTTANTNGNDGDYVSIYLDWVDTHPDADSRTSSWDASSYSNNNSGTQQLGWISADYHGNIAGSRGFASYTKFGPNKNQSATYKYRFTDSGWACEWFIPWRDKTQSDTVKNGGTIPCSIGFQVGDDSDINKTATPDLEQDVVIRYDQRQEIGLNYYSDYSRLAELNFVKGHNAMAYSFCTVGKRADKVCKECGYVYRENLSYTAVSGKPESHVFVVSADSTDASCDEDGVEILECKYCTKVQETVLPAYGHNYEYSEREGKHICSNCHGRAEHGDVDGDGEITNADVLAIYRYIYDPAAYPVDELNISDVDGDGAITNADVLEVYRYIYDPETYPIAQKRPEVKVAGKNLSDYVIIYPEDNALGEMDKALALAESIKAKYGLDIEVYADTYDTFEYEIIIGRADRAESDAIYAADFAYDGYSISVGEKKITLGFGDNKFALGEAVEELDGMITKSGYLVSRTANAVAEAVLTSFMFTDVHNNFAMLEPTNNYGDYIVRKNVKTAIDNLLSTVGAVDVVLVGGDLMSDYHSWNSSGKLPYKYFVEYREILVETFKRLSKDGKVSYVAGNHDYAQGELSTDGPGKNGSYNSCDFYFGDVGMRQDWGELPEEDMFVKIGEKTGEKYLLAYYYEVNGVGIVGLSADHDKVWSEQGSGFDADCLEWLKKKLDEVDPDGDKVIFVNCHYFVDNRTKINADGSNTYSNTSTDKPELTDVFLGHKNLYHIFGHGEVWYSDTTARYVSHHNENGVVIDVTGKETDSTQVVSYEERDFTSIYGGHFRPDANSYPQWFKTDYVIGYAGTDKYGYTHRSTCTPTVTQGLYIQVFEDRIVFTMKNFGSYRGYKTTDIITPYTVWLYK